MTVQVQHRLFPGFAGVALADILANGVAIIIMMIAITMMIKHEQEKKRLEQVEDVSVLLSRKIATSVVMNALPTSPPARLHDYKTSPLDRNPVHHVMPIIEIHGNYIRNYYTGETFTRDQLLLQNNAFDKYLKTLDRTQRNYIRMDIYDIQLFYIVMSILKDYDARPNHWHFIGYSGEGRKATGAGRLKDKEGKFPPDGKADESSQQPGKGQPAEPREESERNQTDARHGIPQNAELDAHPDATKNYPYDDLAYENGGPQEQLKPEELPDNTNPSASEWAKTSDNLFNALAQMMTEDPSQRVQRRQTRLSRFRAAYPGKEKNKGQPGDRQEEEKEQARILSASSMRQLLPALFEFMRQVQEEADAGGATRLAEYNFLRDIMPLLQKRQTGSLPAHLEQLFDRLDTVLDQTPDDTDAPPMVTQKIDPGLRANVLSVQTNDRIATVKLAGNAIQSKREDLPGKVTPTLHFSLYPAIYKGLRAPLKKDTVLLMHPQQKTPREFHWRVVTLVSPAVDDFMTAFVYSALDDQGQLLIASEENALSIDNYRVATNYPVTRFRSERWLLTIYGIPALLLALGVLRRSRKTA